MNVLLVCTGNTCRSPMAAEMLKEMADDVPLKRNVKVKSAGTFAAEDMPATGKAITVMSEKGYDIKHHKSAQFNQHLADWADIILTMEAKHIENIEAMVPEAEAKCHTLLGFVEGVAGYPGDGRFDIIDPFDEPIEEYIVCADILELAVKKLINLFESE
jgi:protein-tyrosine-phosphatase